MSESGAGESFIKKVDNVLDSHFDKKIGKYSTAIDGNPKSSGLRVGNLQIGDDVNNLHDFVYVPEEFDFRTYDNMKELFEVLGISEPDLVFKFVKNYSVVPSKEKKTLKEWQEDFDSDDHKVTSLFEMLEDDHDDHGGEEDIISGTAGVFDSPQSTRVAAPRNRSMCVGQFRDASTPLPVPVNIISPGGISPNPDTSLDSVHVESNSQTEERSDHEPPANREGTSANVAARSVNGGEGRQNKKQIQMAKESFPDPAKEGDRIRRTKEATASIFSDISDFKSTVFLITNPFGGNMLSELALNALKEKSTSTVESIGLFHTDRTELLDGRLTVLKHKFVKEETKIKEKIRIERKTKDWMRFSAFDEEFISGDGKKERRTRMPIPDEVVELWSVPKNDTPRKAIRVDCKLTHREKEIRKDKRGITRIPGGLADKCSHRLIFTSKKRMQEFGDFFCDTHPTGIFACGGSYRGLQIAKNALKASGKPLFAIEGTGFVPTIVDHIFSSGTTGDSTDKMIERKAYRKILADLSDLLKKPSLIFDFEPSQSDFIRYELLYEEKLLELLDSLNTSVYQIDENYKFHKLNRTSKDNNSETQTQESEGAPKEAAKEKEQGKLDGQPTRTPRFHGKELSFSFCAKKPERSFQHPLQKVLRKVCSYCISSPCTSSIRKFWYENILSIPENDVDNYLAERKGDSYWEGIFFEASSHVDAAGDNDAAGSSEVPPSPLREDAAGDKDAAGSSEVPPSPLREDAAGDEDASHSNWEKILLSIPKESKEIKLEITNDKEDKVVDLKPKGIQEILRVVDLEPKGIQEILRDYRSGNTCDYRSDGNIHYHLCKIFPRKNSSGKRNGWILVEVPKEVEVEKGLERAERLSNLVKNFMNFPCRELKIGEFVHEAQMPIIGVDYECKIIQCNQKAKRIFGMTKTILNDGKTKLFDMLKGKLAGSEITNEKLESFLHDCLEENVLTSTYTLEISINRDGNLRRGDSVSGSERTVDDESYGGSDKYMDLLLTCIPRHDRKNKKILLGAYFVFKDITIKKPILETSLPIDESTLHSGEVLVTSDRSVINKSQEDAYHLIKRRSDRLEEVKDKISEIMSKASDCNSELGGTARNNEAIDDCILSIKDAREATKRYRRQAVLFQLAVQILVLVTTLLTVFKLHCDGDESEQIISRQLEEVKNTILSSSGQDFAGLIAVENATLWCFEAYNKTLASSGTRLLQNKNGQSKFCKNVVDRDNLITTAIIILPVFAAIFQTFIYTFRPKWKSARLWLMEKQLESEMFKFRARVGPYNAFDSMKKGSHDSVRKKFVNQCKKYYDVCMATDIKSGTMHKHWEIYERNVRPCLGWFRSGISFPFNRIKGCFAARRRDRILSRPIMSWCCRETRKNRREQKLEDLVSKREMRNRDLENQNEGSHPFHLSDEEKRLLDCLKKAEEKKARVKRKKEEAADYEDKYSILSIDDYKRKRLIPQFIKFKSHLPRVVWFRNTLQALIILFTSASTILAALSTDGDRKLAFLIPVSLALAAFLGNMLTFFQLETRVPILHQSCFGELNKAMLQMNSPATLERRLQTQKNFIINWVEESILSYYYFMVEDQLESGKEETRNQDNTKDGEGEQRNGTLYSPSGEIRNNGNNSSGDRTTRNKN